MNDETALTTIVASTDPDSRLQLAGLAANNAASAGLLPDYRARKSPETLRRQTADIALFEKYLQAVDVPVAGMIEDLTTWRGVTHGLVDGFIRWQLKEGYAIGSINVRLSTIKTYCRMAARAGYIDGASLALIRAVAGYKPGEVRNVDADRVRLQLKTRQPKAKKAEPLEFGKVHASMLKKQPDTSRGRRDRLIVCLILDHGLRVSEIADLDRKAIDMTAGTLRFYRRKVDKIQTHQLTDDTWQAAQAYLVDRDPMGNLEPSAPLFAGTRRARTGRYSTRAINNRIRALGRPLELKTLSPHDGRHYWATIATRAGTDTKSLQDAGGWSSPAMPLRYAASSHIANQGVKLS
jgi:integrase